MPKLLKLLQSFTVIALIGILNISSNVWAAALTNDDADQINKLRSRLYYISHDVQASSWGTGMSANDLACVHTTSDYLLRNVEFLNTAKIFVSISVQMKEQEDLNIVNQGLLESLQKAIASIYISQEPIKNVLANCKDNAFIVSKANESLHTFDLTLPILKSIQKKVPGYLTYKPMQDILPRTAK